jgi:WD40 repeat protein
VRPRLIRALTGHTDSIFAVAFSPDGTLVATSSGDQTAWLWVLGKPSDLPPAHVLTSGAARVRGP